MRFARLLGAAAAALAILAACVGEPAAPQPTASVTPYPFVTATRPPTLAPVYVTATREAAPTVPGGTLTPNPNDPLAADPPTETPLPTSAIGVCPPQPQGVFSAAFAAQPDLIGRLGCVLPPAASAPVQHWPVSVQYQPMERGHLLWVSQVGWYEGGGVVYALFDDGSYSRSDDTYRYASDSAAGGPEPPEGLYQPVENLGKTWRETPGLADRLGFGTALPLVFDGEMQLYQFGAMVHIVPRGQVAILSRRDGVTAWQLVSTRALAVPPARTATDAPPDEDSITATPSP